MQKYENPPHSIYHNKFLQMYTEMKLIMDSVRMITTYKSIYILHNDFDAVDLQMEIGSTQIKTKVKQVLKVLKGFNFMIKQDENY